MSIRKEYEMAFRLRGVLEDTFKTSFKEASQLAIALEKDARELNKVWNDYKSIEGYIEKQNAYTGSIGTVRAELTQLKEEEAGYREQLEQLKKAQEEATDGTVDYSEKIETLENKIDKNLKKQKSHNKSIEDYEEKIEYAREEQERFKSSMESLGYSYENYEEHLDEIKAGLEEVRQAEKRLAEVNKERQQEYEYLQKNYHQLRKIAQVYRDIAVAGYNTFIKPQAEFEETMSAVEAYSGATEQELAQMEAMARNIGKETKFTSSESAEAFETMAKAGWNAKQSMQGIPGVINLALISEEDIGTTAGIVTDNLNAFGLEIKDATHFTDVLAATATKSNTDIFGLSESLKYCNAVAGSMKFTAEDTALMLGLLGDNGVKGSRAGTTMRRIMSALSEDLKLVKENGEEVIISTADADGNMRSLDSIITDLRTHFNGMTEAERAAMMAGADLSSVAESLGIDLLNENGLKKSEEELEEEIDSCTQALKEQGKVAQAEAIAQKTGMSGLLAIMGTTDERYNDLKDSIYNCAGAAKKMADIKMDNLNGDIELMKSSWEELTMTAGEYFNEDLREYAQSVKDKIDSTQEWIANNQDLIRSLVKVAGKLGVVTGGYVALKTGARGVNVVFKDIQKVSETLKLSKAIKGVKDLATGTKSVGTVATSLVSYIKSPGGALAVGGAVLALIGGITAAIIKARKEAEQQEIDRMFGDISLSMEECERVARELVDSDVIRSTAEAFKAFEDVKYAEENLTSLKEKLDKYNWMVDVGLKLTPEEEQEYHDTITNYVSTLQTYVKDRQYAVSLNLKATFGEDSEIYKDFEENGGATRLEEEAIAVGKRINELISQAASEDLIADTKEELEAKIQELYVLIGQIDEQYAEAKRRAALDEVKRKNGTAVDFETAKKINEETIKYTNEANQQQDANLTQSAVYEYNKLLDAEQALAKNPNDEQAKIDRQNALANIEEINTTGHQKIQAQNAADALSLLWQSIPQEIQAKLDEYTKAVAAYEEAIANFNLDPEKYKDEVEETYANMEASLNKITNADRKIIEGLGIENYIAENTDLIDSGWQDMLAKGDRAAAEAVTSIMDMYSDYIWYQMSVVHPTWNKAVDAYNVELVDGKYGTIGRTGVVRATVPRHAGGTNYTSDSFYAGENGRTELITGAAGKKVYTAFETSEILRNIREAEAFLPYYRQIQSTAHVEPKTLAGAFENPGKTVIEFTHSPVIHAEGTNVAEIKVLLEEDRKKTFSEFEEFLRRKEQDDRRRRFS